MKFSLASRLLSLCLAFGLLFGTCLPSYASSGLYVPTAEDVEMFLEGFEPTNPEDSTSGLFDYFNDYFPAPLGNVNDDNTGITSYSIRYYGGLGFGGWSSETNWTTSSNIAVNKTFSASDVVNSIPKSGVDVRDLATSSYFTPSIGYTISFLRDEQGPFVKGSKVNLALNFTDTAISSNVFIAQYRDKQYYAMYQEPFQNYYNTTNGYNLLNLTALNSSSSSSFVTTMDIVGFNNIVTIGGVTTDGDYLVIDTINNISQLDVDVTMPEDIQYITCDVEYNAKNVKTPSYPAAGNNNYFVIPLVYNFDLSGSISLDEGSITSGLLGSIVDWLKSILNSIRELPDKIVNGIKTVLQELFVPDAEFISGKFEEFKLLAENKLGFLFTMLDMVVDLFTTLSTNISEPMETLTIPSLVLPFEYADGGQMVLWQEMTFDVFPDGLDVLLNLVHLVTSIVIVTATINYAVFYVKRFFEKE